MEAVDPKIAMRVYQALIQGAEPAQADIDKLGEDNLKELKAEIETMKKDGVVASIPD